VIGERLFKSARVRSDVGNDESDEDRAAVQRFLIEKLASSVLEFTERRLAQGPAAGAGKIQTPLPGLRIVQTDAHAFEVTRGPVAHKYDQVSPPAPDFADHGRAFIVDPGSRSG